MKSPIPNLAVRDVSAAVSFYETYLGFKAVDQVPDPSGSGGLVWAAVENQRAKIFFQQADSLYQEYPSLRPAAEAGARLGGSFSMQVPVDDVDAMFAKLAEVDAAKSVNVVKQPMTTFYGLREAAIADLNGYVLVFASPAPTPAADAADAAASR